jgi:hypothetical protein
MSSESHNPEPHNPFSGGDPRVAARVVPAVVVEPPWAATHTTETPTTDTQTTMTQSVVSEIVVPRRALWRRTVERTTSVAEWLFGAATLVVGLAVLAAIPILQFLTLGYLLEASGRVARTGRLRSAAIGVRQAARVGGIVVGIRLCLLPLQLIAVTWQDAVIVDTTGAAAANWRVAFWIVAVLMTLHVTGALVKGGRLRHFLAPSIRPVRLVRWMARLPYAECRDAVCDFVVNLRLPYYFWLGLRGFVGGFVLLAPPIALLALGRQIPPLGVLGGVLLGIVVLYVPFLQTQFAAENRLAAMFAWRRVRATYRAAPLAFWIALAATLTSAVPLYLLKIEMIPREAAWLPSLVFVAFMFPARILTGWAVGRGMKRQKPRHVFWRTVSRLGMLPVAAVYVLLVFLTQFTSWHGLWSLYEQHAFLLPVPFLSM